MAQTGDTTGDRGRHETARSPRDPISKSIRLLAWLVDRGPQTSGVREIAAAFAMPPSSVHRLLSGLEQGGLVQRVEGGRYELGLEFFRLAWRSTSRFPVREIALPALEELAAASQETALLGLYEPGRRQMLFAASVESPQTLRYVVDLNKWLPVHCGASGLAILAFLPPDEIEVVVRETRLEPVAEKTITDADELGRELARVRERGYACTQGQRIAGAVGIGAPVWGPAGTVVGDVMITMPEQRFDPEAEQVLATLVKNAASRITHALGGAASDREQEVARATPSPPPAADRERVA